MTLFLLVVIFLITFTIFKNYEKKRNNRYPPGPINLPFVGSLYKLEPNKQHLSLDKLYHKYGKVFSMKFGSIDTIILNEPDVIAEAFHLNSTSFMDRMMLPSFEIVGRGQNVGFSKTNYWKKIRGILNQSLTKSKTRLLEDLFNQQYFKFEQFIVQLIKSNGTNQPIYIRPYLKKLSFNIIYSFLFGETISYQDDQIPNDVKGFLKASEELLVILSNQPSDFIKILRPFTSHKKLLDVLENMLIFIKPRVSERIKNLDPNNPKCFIDYLIIQIMNDHLQLIKVEAVQYICIDLLVGGTDTSSTTLEWMILYLSNNEGIQEKLYNEISTVSSTSTTTGGQFPKLSDKNDYPFFNASIRETFRKSPPVPLGLPHQCSEDTEIGGYIIPKGSQVISNIYSASQCGFNDPFEFNPLRFIDQFNPDKKQSVSVSFSIGPRICPGKNFSEDELFLIGTKLFKTFKFSKPSNIQQFDESGVVGITLEPHLFPSIITIRN